MEKSKQIRRFHENWCLAELKVFLCSTQSFFRASNFLVSNLFLLDIGDTLNPPPKNVCFSRWLWRDFNSWMISNEPMTFHFHARGPSKCLFFLNIVRFCFFLKNTTQQPKATTIAGWWFHFFIFIPIWGNDPNLTSIFFKWVGLEAQTTSPQLPKVGQKNGLRNGADFVKSLLKVNSGCKTT